MFGPKTMKGFFGWGHRPGFGHGPRRRRMFEKGEEMKAGTGHKEQEQPSYHQPDH